MEKKWTNRTKNKPMDPLIRKKLTGLVLFLRKKNSTPKKKKNRTKNLKMRKNKQILKKLVCEEKKHLSYALFVFLVS